MKTIKRFSINWGKGGRSARLVLLLVGMACLVLLATTATTDAADPPRAHPALLKFAKDHPNDKVRVIVQEYSKEKLTDQEHKDHGMKDGRKLPMINGFVAEMPLNKVEALARNKKVRWVTIDAPVRMATVANETVADSFPGIGFNGNTGTQTWTNNWQELGESDGAGSGVVQVKPVSGFYYLSIGGNSQSIVGSGVSREADLSFATSATFSFNYQRMVNTPGTGSVSVQVSGNGGTSWTTLATYALNATDAGFLTQSFDISPFIASNTQIRIIGSGTVMGSFYIGDVQIAYGITTKMPTPPTFSAVRDEFATAGSYSGNNGTANWSTSWLPASNGNVQVVSNTLCASNGGNCLLVMAKTPGDSVVRTANLTGASSATLLLWRNNLLNNTTKTDAVVLEASANGGNWTTLRTWWNTLGDGGDAYESFDLTPYISATTQIRFRVLQAQNYGNIYFDNIQIQYTPLLNTYDTAIDADKVWKNAPYLDGTGIGVAVVDSGVSGSTDLTSRITASANFTAMPNANDDHGHGTFVAGMIGGNGNNSGKQRTGVAPGVNLINVRVADNQGRAYTSDMVNALQWIYDNRTAYNIKVVNISMNGTVPDTYQTSPLCAAVEILWFNKIVVVVSAGNNGTGNGPVTLYPPANDPFVITVGSTDDKGTRDVGDDVLNAFSAYGNTESGFAKPDLVAPGKNIISALPSTSSYVYNNYPDNRVDSNYFRMSGTSMSSGVVSGAVALLLQASPNLNPDQVKYRLKATANQSWNYDAVKAGAGIVNVFRAVKGKSTQAANGGIPISNLLFTGANTSTWDSANWDSANWDSANWDSANWDSANWDSALWDSASWGRPSRRH